MTQETVTTFAVTTTVPGFITHTEIISGLRQKYHGAEYNVSNATGMAKAVAARKELRDARIALDKAKPEVKKEALDFCAKVEADYKAIRAAVCEYEEIPDAIIEAHKKLKATEKAERERKEAERKAAIVARIDKIRNLPLATVGFNAEKMTAFIAQVQSVQIGVEFEEMAEQAETARTEVVAVLTTTLETLQAQETESLRIKAEQEAEAARLEELRIEQEKAATVERERIATEQAERDRLHAIEREKLEAEQAEQKRLNAIEQEKFAAERAELDLFRKENEERQRIAAEKIAAERAESDRIEGERQAQINSERAELEAKEKAKRDEEARVAAEVTRKSAAEAEVKAKEAEKVRKLAEREKKLANARCADAKDALKKILAICADKEALSPAEALDQIALIAEASI